MGWALRTYVVGSTGWVELTPEGAKGSRFRTVCLDERVDRPCPYGVLCKFMHVA